jgi:hypothetical protein
LEYCFRPLLYCFLGNLDAGFGLSRTEWDFVTEFKRARELGTALPTSNLRTKVHGFWLFGADLDGGIWYAGLSLTNTEMTKLNDEVQCLFQPDCKRALGRDW